jgi:hypothetical protein
VLSKYSLHNNPDYAGYFVTRERVQRCFRGSWLRETEETRETLETEETQGKMLSAVARVFFFVYLVPFRPSRPSRLFDNGRLPRNCMEGIGYLQRHLMQFLAMTRFIR